MASQRVELPDIGTVTLQKHRRARSLKIALLADGTVRATLPTWVPYKTALAFVKSRREWILEHRQVPDILQHKQAIGKAHHLYFEAKPTVSKATSHIKDSVITITHPAVTSNEDVLVQACARAAATKVLRKEAQQLLPQRLQTLAEKHDFSYSSVSVRQLRARWGSCNSKQEITLNIFLMQLPWDLIDYVLLHELVHTKHMHHGADFWATFEKVLPDAKAKRRQMRQHKPTI